MSLCLLATVTETTILSFICLAALISNLSLYIIVYKNKDLQTITNLYILNLAAADIMVSVVSIPFTVVTVITGHWLFSERHSLCGTRLLHDFVLHFVCDVSWYDRHPPIFLHRQVEHLHKDLLEEEKLVLRCCSVASLDIFGFPSAFQFRLSRIPLHSWKIILLRSLAFKCVLHVFHDHSLLFWASFRDRFLVSQHFDVYKEFRFQGITSHYHRNSPIMLTEPVSTRIQQ